MDNLDEELLARAEEENRRREELEQAKQQDQLREEQQAEQARQQNSPANQLKNVAKDPLQQAGKQIAKQAAQKVILATAPYWGSALLILAGVALVLFVVIAVPVVVCKSSYFEGVTTAIAKGVFSASGICSAINGVQSGGVGGTSGGTSTGSLAGSRDLVTLIGVVNVDPQTSDPRVRACMLAKVQELFTLAEDAGLVITVTGAYRSEMTASNTPSAHSRGEAVDLGLRAPPIPWDQNTHSLPAGFAGDLRIAELVQIGKSVGFVPPVGDTLDEYHSPAPNATGGHVHIEFNRTPSVSYCDNANA